MTCAGLLRIDAELDSLARRLGASTSDHERVLKAIVVESFPCQRDRGLPLLARQVLGFSVASLDQDSSDTALRAKDQLKHDEAEESKGKYPTRT